MRANMPTSSHWLRARSPNSEPKIQDEAYYRCLNMDQEPEMPTTSAYYGTSVDASAQGGPLEPVAGGTATAANNPAPNDATPTAPAGQQAAAAAIGAGTADGPAPPEPVKKTASNAPSGHSYTGGKKPWSPEWYAACKQYFPNSFNEKDGTILPHGSNKRVLCR